MRIDDSIDFAFPPSGRDLQPSRCVLLDKCNSYKVLSNAWQFECECKNCPTHRCAPKRRDASCAEKVTCRAHPRTGLQAVDVVWFADRRLYLIEVKDFNRPGAMALANFGNPQVLSHYLQSVSRKFRDSLFAIWCGGYMAAGAIGKESLNLSCIRRLADSISFVFHIEVPLVSYKSGFFPKQKVISLSTIRSKLGQYLGGELVDWLKVVDIDEMKLSSGILPWQTKRVY